MFPTCIFVAVEKRASVFFSVITLRYVSSPSDGETMISFLGSSALTVVKHASDSAVLLSSIFVPFVCFVSALMGLYLYGIK